jgi:hypothetical protein
MFLLKEMISRGREISIGEPGVPFGSDGRSGINQEFERLDMGDVWRNGEENNRNLWREVSKRCVDVERQIIEASMEEKRSLVFYNELKSRLEKKLYIKYAPKRLEEAYGGGKWASGN